MSSKTCLLLIYYLTIIVISVLSIQTSPDANYVSFPASENGTCYKRIPFDDEVANNISAGLIQLVSGSQSAPIKSGPGAARGWATVIDCCEGYTRDPDTGRCETHCEEGCLGGNCVGPNQCQCEENWYPEAGICKPICHRPCAENAYCFSPGVCKCLFGFEERNGVCKPVCLHDCQNGECVAPRECQCHQGYRLNETQHCEPICESGCPHGQCRMPEMCRCDKGYESSRYTPETCVPSCPDTCINGECQTPDVCTCQPGYEDSSGSCQPICRDGCENGQCVAPDRCQCDPPFVWDRQSKKCNVRREGSYYQSDYETDQGYGYSTTSAPQHIGGHYVTNSPTRPHGIVGTSRPQDSNHHQSFRDRPGTYGEQQSYGSQYQTTSPRVPYGSASTYHPQGLNRYQGSRDGTDDLGVIPLQRKPDSQQSGIYNRNRESDDQQNPLDSRDSHRDHQESTHIQKIDGPMRNHTRPEYSRGRYGNDQSTEEPQRFLTESSSLPSDGYGRGRDSYRTSTSSHEYGNVQTHERPRPDQEYLHGPRDREHNQHGSGNYGQRINQTHKLQGPFPPQSADSTRDYGPDVNHPHWADNDRSTQNPQSSDSHHQRPYNEKGYDQAQNSRGYTSPTQRPDRPQTYNQAQNSHNYVSPTQRPHDAQGYGRTQRPQNQNHPYLQNQPNEFQETLTENDSIEGSTRPYQGQNRPYDHTQGRYNNPQRQQGNHNPRLPYSTTSSSTHQTNAYDTASQRYPYSDRSTSRPQVGQETSPDRSYQGYGRDGSNLAPSTTLPSRYSDRGRVYESPSDPTRPVYGGTHNQLQPQNHGNYVNFEMINHAGNDGIAQGLPVDGVVIPVFNQYGPFCEMPCLNGQCIGPNVCLCNPGYGPDLNNPYSTQCVPMCSEECFNGICTAPNLCICKAGFRKEYGVKGSNYCVPNV